ncbi:MAG TPA: hypothetical protein VHJ20_15075 [Polyangia bacterium]|nr:hypothetical protein [Polyangia bacterium]
MIVGVALALAACGGSQGGGATGGSAGGTGGTGGGAASGGTGGESNSGGGGGTSSIGGSGGVTASGGSGGDTSVGGSGGSTSTGGAADGGAGSGGTDGGAPDAPPAAGCSAPGAICWDFETGALPTGWTPYRNEFNGTLLVDGTRPYNGSRYSLHAKDLMGNVEGKDGGPKKTMKFNLPSTFGPTLWGRAFIYVDPARPMSHAGLFNARYPRPGAAAGMSTTISTLDWYEVASSAMNYVSIYHPPEPPGTPEWVQTSDTPLVLGHWACMEWLFDAKNGDAAEAADPRVWIDGTEIVWSNTFVSPSTATRPTHEKATTFTVLEAGVYLYQGLSTATNWWIDDLGVSPQRIGCN